MPNRFGQRRRRPPDNRATAGSMSATALHPQLQSIDFRRDVSVLEVPVYLVQGAYEMGPCAQLVPEWFDALSIGPLPHRR